MITIHIPKGSQSPDINKEIMSAKNIKDRNIKNSTLEGLNKINQYL